MSSIPTSRRPTASRTRNGSSISLRSEGAAGTTRSTRITSTTAAKRPNTDLEAQSAVAGSSKPAASGSSSVASGAGTRPKRSAIALTEVTNQRKRAAAAVAAAEGKGKEASKAGTKIPSRSQSATTSTSLRTRTAESTSAAISRRARSVKQEEAIDVKSNVRRVAASSNVRSATTRRNVLGDRNVRSTAPEHDVDPSTFRESKRLKIEEAADVPAKDEGWEDLDAEDGDDPLMVAEYVVDIFEYMKRLEMDTMPNPDYMTLQNEEITWSLRAVLTDWLIDTHQKFRLLPETLFLAVNIVDRFLSARQVSLSKLQLIGVTAMFVAAKYEEVLCPSVQNFLYISDGGYTDEEILNAEAYLLNVLQYNLSYPNPMNFLRRISKADSYDIQTRTVAKYLMEISLVDYRLMEHTPSKIAAAAVWMARQALERGEWTPTLVHYSSYSEVELLPAAELMLDYCLRDIKHESFHKKYAGKKFLKASTYVRNWALERYGDTAETNRVVEQVNKGGDFSVLRVDLFEELGLERPVSTPSEFQSDTPLPDCSIFDQRRSGGGSSQEEEERIEEDEGAMSDESLY